YLLDPAASPPARVSTSDGMIAAMMFFVIQGIVLAAVMAAAHHLTGGAVISAYTAAGAATFCLFRLVYWRSKTQGVPTILGGAGLGVVIAWGVTAGLVAATVGVLYMYSLKRLDLFQDVMHESAKGLSAGSWLPLLAILAAPLFEEFIFRGLIFGGLRRSLNA